MAEPVLTRDGFLGDRVRLFQPAAGFRAGTDSVFLQAFVPAREGESVLELGCGPGIALFCLGARVPRLRLSGVEQRQDYAAIARKNASATGIAAEIITGGLKDAPRGDGGGHDHVMMNAPYFDASRGTAAADPGREGAHRGQVPLGDWIDTAARRLRPGGRLALIQHIDRLPEVLAALDMRMGSLRVVPLAGRADRAAGRFLLSARKGGRAAFRLEAPLILHQGGRHGAAGDGPSALADAVLRGGQPLPCG